MLNPTTERGAIILLSQISSIVAERISWES
jgi:hypothetical protein